MPIAINGTGTVTGLSVGGLPDGSVAQADLATGVAGTGPAFSVSATTTTVPNVTTTNIVMTSKAFDTANCYNTVTGQFTPNVAGYYQFNADLIWGGTGGGTIGGKTVSLRKNNADFVSAAFSTSDSGAWEAMSISGLVYLNGSTDFVTVGGYVNGGSITPQNCIFSGFLARAA